MTRLLLCVILLAWPALAFGQSQDRLCTGEGNTGWAFTGGTNRCTSVDDTIGAPDDDTTYDSTAGNAQQQLTYTAFSIDAVVDSIDVRVTTRCKYTVSGSASIGGLLRVNATNYTTGIVALTTSYVDNTHTWTTNPNTAAEWLEADVEGTGANPLQQFGFASSSVAGGAVPFCTQAYVTVIYTDSASGAVRSRLLGGGFF